MALLRVGSHELTFLKTPENLIRLAHQVFLPMAFLGVGSCVLAPSSICFWLDVVVADTGRKWEDTFSPLNIHTS